MSHSNRSLLNISPNFVIVAQTLNFDLWFDTATVVQVFDLLIQYKFTQTQIYYQSSHYQIEGESFTVFPT